MGWKTFKEHFGIQHIVQVRDENLLIGSAYVSDLAAINMQTGYVKVNDVFSRFLVENYPDVLSAGKEKILALIAEPDKFSVSLPVYTYNGSEIIEDQCEAFGWPNITHTGRLMYEGSYFEGRAGAIAKAIKVSKANLVSRIARVAELTSELKAAHESVDEYKAILENLESMQ